ncbi:MAG: cation diffusion facilitator family transporter [Chromatiales bacterium]
MPTEAIQPRVHETDPRRRERLLRLATRSSVATALVLILGKLAAWLLTGSVSVLASLIDSVMDALASTINLLAIRYALRPADEEHRFGHGKAEALAGLGQATFIAGSAMFLTLHAVDRLLHPQPIAAAGVGIAVMAFAIVATLVLLAIQRYVVRHTGSTAIKADSLHYFTDLITNLSIIAALVLATFGWPGLDPVFALGIAAYILFSAWQIGREAVGLLMDRELPEEVRRRIVELAFRPEEVLGVHDLRTRQSGHRYFVQVHLEMEDGLSLTRAHAAAESVEQAVREAFPGSEVIVHQDPVGVVDHSRVAVEAQPRPSA